MTLLSPARLIAGLSLLLASAAHAQSVPQVGSPTTLDVATWNIEWFGDPNNGPSNDTQQLERVVATIAGTGIDLWGVQEIADEADFAALLDALGADFDGRLATNSGTQRVGFIFDTRTIRLRQVRHILEDFSDAFAFRPPLQLEADVMLPDTTVVVTFIVVHMKAFSDVDSYERRTEAALRLKNHIDFTSLASKPVIVLGDFNDQMDGSITSNRPSPYALFIDDPADYRALTLPLELDGAGSFCANANCTATDELIDHILVTNEAAAWAIEEATAVMTDLPFAFTLYASTTSDHLPVYARFSPTMVNTGVDSELPVRQTLGFPFPNPFSGSTHLTISGSTSGPVRLSVFDSLGREVAALVDEGGVGERMLTIEPRGWPAGVYWVRSTSGSVRRLVYLP